LTNTQQLYQAFLQCSAVCTDTRQILPNSMFVALKGPNFDANSLATEALAKGARFAVVDNPAYATQPNILLVANGLLALQDLARHHRSTWHIPVLGLTGSNGKTTSKELIHSVLSQKYIAYATKGNLNNHIGVPLTILNCPANAQIAIIEMGANHQHEIQLLCSIAQPTHGLITNIGKAHLEGFGGIEGVKKGKGELYDYLAAHQGTVFVNASSIEVPELAAQRHFHQKIEYQQPNSPNQIRLKAHNPLVIYTDAQGNTVHTQLTGSYNFENIVNALTIGYHFGLSHAAANLGIISYVPQNNRSQFVLQGSNHLLLDAYNANPSSMAAAIINFDHLRANKKMVILGDMLELGAQSQEEHRQLGLLLSHCNFDKILLAGPAMQAALAQLPQAYYFPDKFGLHNWLQDHQPTHYHVLIKGSRGMSLETCLPFFNH
jgi:UDP-N-acetylmuramoyl-tripeptide--D-alanyl-D-alanine ligase